MPNGRLVILGEPGSGKSVLAILLTLGLLKDRAPGGPLPVLLPASSWDPVRESLDDWIVRTLALPYYSGRPEIPRTLLVPDDEWAQLVAAQLTGVSATLARLSK
ncbi:hypothetical protein [Streptomyces sp. NPDC007205]|uniref:hypothetical protein n=1 Tax=Streptomyces sp. NPDC007205 TaxID=3154316 RepID=UPI0033FEE469